jgi:hypothetical protein
MQNDEAGVLTALEHSVHLVPPGGVIRLFADHGPKMADLLRCLAGRRVAEPFLEKLLAAFTDIKDILKKTGYNLQMTLITLENMDDKPV